MAVLRGAICKTPVSLDMRQELPSCKFWPAWTWHKSRNVNSNCDFVVTVLADGWTNVVTQRARKESKKETLLVCLWRLWKGVQKSISFRSLEATYELEGTAGGYWTFISTSYFSDYINGIIKPFSGEGDVVTWLKKVRLVARLQMWLACYHYT